MGMLRDATWQASQRILQIVVLERRHISRTEAPTAGGVLKEMTGDTPLWLARFGSPTCAQTAHTL
jgi:hypothetical protein